jgi:hypothetical protein
LRKPDLYKIRLLRVKFEVCYTQQVEAEFSPIPSMKKIVAAKVSSPGPSFGQG